MALPLDKSAYLICGDDEFRVSIATRDLLDALVPESERDFGLDRIDGRVGTVDETLAIIRGVCDAFVADSLFGAGRKTVWLREPSFLSNDRVAKSEAVREKIPSLVALVKDGLGDGMRLVVSTLKINRASAFFKAFSGKNGAVLDFGGNLKPRQKADAAAELVEEYCGRLGLRMSADARRLFLSRAGTESRQLVSELEKLANYCGDSGKAEADDVRAIVSSGAVSEIWDLLDAFATRDAKTLVSQVRIQLAQGENAIRMVNSLLSTVGDLLAIREGRERKWAAPDGGGLDWSALPAEISEGLDSGEKSILHASGFPLRKKIDQSAGWTVRELRNARHYLIELREMLVSRALPEDFLLETKLLQAICKRPAKAQPGPRPPNP